MLGRQDRWQEDLFVLGPMSDLIPDDHILKRVDRVLDLSWLRDEVKDCYNEKTGRPGIDPEAAVRLMIAGFFEGIVHDRKLMRQAEVNLAIRWFAGYRLHEPLPHHSSLTRIRQRWGEERFCRIFERGVKDCVKAGLVDGETVHIDATLIRADVSWRSLTERHTESVLRENEETPKDDSDPPPVKRGRPRKQKAEKKKYSRTDPDATMATSSRKKRLTPSYKQHTAVDDKAGVIVDVAITTGEVNEGKQLEEQIKRVESNTGKHLSTATADASYAHARNFGMLEDRGTAGVIPPQRPVTRAGRIPAGRFKYDRKNKVVKCLRGRLLRPSGRAEDKEITIYRARVCDCRKCPLRARCVPKSGYSRTIRISDHQDALIRARRRHWRRDPEYRRMYSRHRWRAEGVYGEAKVQHGLRRAVRRGIDNVAIQSYMTAVVMNLKRLAAAACAVIRRFVRALACVHSVWPRQQQKTPSPATAIALRAA